ncbi:MAG: DUF3592 domain-containing protein [Chloroflexi bacterium]|nr:DUF3592 domain-containing protein [Chloroflexota bacterium]
MNFLIIAAAFLLLILGFVGLVLTTGALRVGRRQRRLDTQGVPTTGEAIEHRASGPNQVVVYQYSVEDTSYRNSENIGPDAALLPPVGSLVEINYLPTDPKTSALAGDTHTSRLYRRLSIGPLIVLVIVFVTMTLGGIALIYNEAIILVMQPR